MKKIVVVLLISILGVCLLVGCAKDEKAHSIEYKVACSTIPLAIYKPDVYADKMTEKVDTLEEYTKIMTYLFLMKTMRNMTVTLVKN